MVCGGFCPNRCANGARCCERRACGDIVSTTRRVRLLEFVMSLCRHPRNGMRGRQDRDRSDTAAVFQAFMLSAKGAEWIHQGIDWSKGSMEAKEEQTEIGEALVMSSWPCIFLHLCIL